MSPHRLSITVFAIALLCILVTGCARFPENVTPESGTRLIISMTVDGDIDPTMYYYVAFDTSGSTTPGPIPIAGIPWGNGWGTGNITSYVLFDQFQPQGYGVYRFQPGSLTDTVFVGTPITYSTPPHGANRLQFAVSLEQIIPPGIDANTIDTININFITTNLRPLDPNTPVSNRYYDALGSRGNDFITISVRNSQTYSNSRTLIEDAGDVRVPNLDIVDWSVEVQKR